MLLAWIRRWILANWIHECDMLGGSIQTTQHRGSLHMRRGTGGLKKDIPNCSSFIKKSKQRGFNPSPTYCHTCHVFCFNLFCFLDYLATFWIFLVCRAKAVVRPGISKQPCPNWNSSAARKTGTSRNIEGEGDLCRKVQLLHI